MTNPTFVHTVTDDEQGVRLDAFVAGLGIEEIASRSSVVRLIESGHILVNEKTANKKQLVAAGDILHIEVPARSEAPTTVTPDYSIDLDIRHEDEHVIVLSKQPGLVCHPSKGHYTDTLANALVAHCGLDNLADVQGEDRPGIVHRLDRDTSGLMLAAKTDIAAARLQDNIREREVDRRYITLVHGIMALDTGMIDAPIARNPKDRTRMMVDNSLNARPSMTTFTVLERFAQGKTDEGYTLLQCKLYTGRTHQIRVHMSYTKHPVVGDPLYGRAVNVKARNRDKAEKAELGLERQFLHSHRITFEHPVTHEILTFNDELPADLQLVLLQLAPRSMGCTKAGIELFGE